MAVENALGFIRSLALGHAPAALVLIAGPQAFLREYVFDALKNASAGGGFNYRAVQAGGSDGFSSLINELEGGDLFAPRRLIGCRVPKSHRERDRGESNGEAAEGGTAGGADEAALAQALERISPAVHVALLYERDNSPARIRRIAEKDGAVVNCMRPFDNQVTQYAEVFARMLKLRLSAEAADLLASRHASDLAAIANVLQKAAITCAEKGKVEVADVRAPGVSRIPDLFEIAESLGRGNLGETLALFDRALDSGRDPIEILAVEIIPLIRRMLTAAALLGGGRGQAEAARGMGFAPGSMLATRALEGARRFGSERLMRAHQRACELDARFKSGQLKERGQAISAMLIDLVAGPGW